MPHQLLIPSQSDYLIQVFDEIHVMKNNVNPDQLASLEANWSGSTLFAKTGHDVISKRKVKWRVLDD